MKRRGAATLLVISMLAAACGGGSSDGIFESPGSQGSATSGGETETAPSGDTGTEPDAASTTTTTTTPEYEDVFDLVAQSDLGDPPPRSSSALGSADVATAAAIAAELVAGDVDLTGLELWVFDVVGSDDRLLVVEASAAAAGFGEDPEGGDLIEALAASPTTQEAGLTRLVINYYDTDDEGAFALTMTLPMELLLGEVDEEVDISQFLDVQVIRVEESG